jgi:hypothetical protein
MTSTRTDKGFKDYVWPKNNEVEQSIIFIYLFYLLDTTLQHLEFNVLFFLNIEVVLKVSEVLICYSFKSGLMLLTRLEVKSIIKYTLLSCL